MAARPQLSSLNTVHLMCGERVAISDIATVEAGQSVLDDLDAGILSIEHQLTRQDMDADWRHRASRALKARKLLRPKVQERIGALRRAEKASAAAEVRATTADAAAANRQARDARSRAFVTAAYALLGAEKCEQIFEHARAIDPAAFAELAR